MRIISSAPCRIGLVGGGTDTSPYCDLYGGLCINFAINIRQEVIVGGKQKLLPNDNPKFFKAFVGNAKVEHKFKGEIESGLGSSAALAVALVSLRHKIFHFFFSCSDIADLAWTFETKRLRLFGGRQDQYIAAWGGFNKMEFTKDEVTVTPLPKKWIRKVYPYMVLLHSGIKRSNPKLQEGLKRLTEDQRGILDSMKAIAQESLTFLKDGNIKELGRLLDLSWQLKRASNKGVTNGKIDGLYEKGITLGALGGKVCGSGGGGCLFFLVPPRKQKKFIREMGLKHIPFKIDWTGVITKVL